MMTQEDIRFWENAYLMSLRIGYSVKECMFRADEALKARKLLFGIK